MEKQPRIFVSDIRGCFVFGGGSDFPGASFLFDFPPVHQCVSNRQFIYVFQFVAEADPPGDRRDFHLRVLAQPVEQIEQGCFAFDRGRDGEDHFPDRSLGDPLDQQVDLQVRRGDALHRRDYTAQYVIESTVLAGIFDREYVGDLFYDTDGRMVALPVGADRTDFFIREVVAQFAVFDVAAESVDAACHVAYRIGFHAQQVDRQAQRRAASDAWEQTIMILTTTITWLLHGL